MNSALVGLYWHIGTRIREDILHEKRAEYGEQIVSALAKQLTVEYGRGFSEKSLWHMMRFAEVFPDEQIVSALRRELSWTHFKEIIYLDDPLKRDFYAEMCRVERWNTRTLDTSCVGMGESTPFFKSRSPLRIHILFDRPSERVYTSYWSALRVKSTLASITSPPSSPLATPRRCSSSRWSLTFMTGPSVCDSKVTSSPSTWPFAI